MLLTLKEPHDAVLFLFSGSLKTTAVGRTSKAHQKTDTTAVGWVFDPPQRSCHCEP
ncbi:MAG: hypothetical protein J6U05_02035 [Neisseriaceae bacterium]|nr:hypothetical protein [Neisseriaceae bacterium]MBO7380434.1 hypothetical protein [Neisseriaceae bacterium]